jgi:hypothetical protein
MYPNAPLRMARAFLGDIFRSGSPLTIRLIFDQGQVLFPDTAREKRPGENPCTGAELNDRA